MVLKALYEKGLEKPLTTDEDGPAHLLPYLVEALEEVVSGVGLMAEVEARVLSSAALTRVFSHLHLRDPDANLDELLEPVDSERFAIAVEAVKSQAEALLGKFRAFTSAPMAGGVVDPAALSGATTGVESMASDDDVQG